MPPHLLVFPPHRLQFSIQLVLLINRTLQPIIQPLNFETEQRKLILILIYFNPVLLIAFHRHLQLLVLCLDLLASVLQKTTLLNFGLQHLVQPLHLPRQFVHQLLVFGTFTCLVAHTLVQGLPRQVLLRHHALQVTQLFLKTVEILLQTVSVHKLTLQLGQFTPQGVGHFIQPSNFLDMHGNALFIGAHFAALGHQLINPPLQITVLLTESFPSRLFLDEPLFQILNAMAPLFQLLHLSLQRLNLRNIELVLLHQSVAAQLDSVDLVNLALQHTVQPLQLVSDHGCVPLVLVLLLLQLK
jgi:hypothetical protein